MKLNVITLALAATALGALSAHAQTSTTTTVISPPAATIVAPAPAVVVSPPPAVVVEQPVVVAPPAVVAAPPGAVVVEQPTSSTAVESSNAGILGNSTRTTTKTTGAGVDCTKRTAQTNTLLGSVTSSNTTCE